MEFVNFRGKNLEATLITVGGQDFLIAAVGDRQDLAIADIYAQQKIEIVPGLKVMKKRAAKNLKFYQNRSALCGK